MQVFLDGIHKGDKLFSNSYWKALNSNGKKRKKRKIKERREVQFMSGLDTSQTRLFIGKKRRKKPKEGPIEFPTSCMGIFLHNELKGKEIRKGKTKGYQA